MRTRAITEQRSIKPPQAATTQNGTTDKNPLIQTVVMSKTGRGKRLKKGVTNIEMGIGQRREKGRETEKERTSTVIERRTGTAEERGNETGTEKRTEAETGGKGTEMTDMVRGTEETAAQKTENGSGKESKIRGTKKARKWTPKRKSGMMKKLVRGKLMMLKKKKRLWKLKIKVMQNRNLVNLQNAAVTRL